MLEPAEVTAERVTEIAKRRNATITPRQYGAKRPKSDGTLSLCGCALGLIALDAGAEMRGVDSGAFLSVYEVCRTLKLSFGAAWAFSSGFLGLPMCDREDYANPEWHTRGREIRDELIALGAMPA